MPVHCRMRAFDRDLIRGGHYGQRSCEPHLKAEHMAAPTNAANVKKALANSVPQAKAVSCPQLAEGDIGTLADRSGFDRGRVKTRLHDCVGSDTRAGGRT